MPVSPASSPPAQSAAGEECVLLEWSIHLLRQDPRRAWAVAVAAGVAAALGFALFRAPLVSAAAVLVIVFSAAEYLFPMRFRLTNHRATMACGLTRLEMPWERVRRVDARGAAICLSPFLTPSRLDGFRGIVLRCAPDGDRATGAEVLSIVRAMVPGEDAGARP